MALQAPACTDTTDIQFVIASKNQIFSNESPLPDQKCSLLATASTLGIVIVGCNKPELRVLQLKDITSQTETAKNATIPLRQIPLPSQPFHLSINCDNSLLAVDVDINGIPHIQIFSVPSFLTNNALKLTEFRTSQLNSRSLQILWNPVIGNMFAVCTENGGLTNYTIKEQGFEFHSLEPNHKAQSISWSPKGKQIVVAFANGKLIQFKPDMKPARIIECPPNICEGPFDVIALQWLSTYQFAAVFLTKNQDATPALHIINAPKAGPPTYINYDDICYSQSGPRKSQVFLTHIIPWNLLLVASSNSIEVGLLGTKESGEAPTWIQWNTTDEARAELPLDDNKKETYPIGFVLETGSTEGIVIGDIKYPVMPLIHILATNGLLVSFNFMNFAQTYVDICSPPKPIDPAVSSLFRSLEVGFAQPPPQIQAPRQNITPPNSEVSFGFGATSTPTAVAKPKPLFGDAQQQQASAAPTGLFQNLAKPTPGFGLLSDTQSSLSFGGIASQAVPPVQPFANIAKPEPPKQTGISFGQAQTASVAPAQQQKAAQPPSLFGNAGQNIQKVSPAPVQAQVPVQPEKPKALITVPPNYNPATQNLNKSDMSAAKDKSDQSQNVIIDSDENNRIFTRMIKDELLGFEKELKEALAGTKRRIKVDVGNEEESARMVKTTDELMDLKKEAIETIDSLRHDVQTLRLELSEMFAMQCEAKNKCDIYKNEKTLFTQDNQIADKTSRRQLEKLRKLLAQNEMQINTIIQQIDSQWSAYLETTSKNKRNKMRVPSLEGLYQTLSKQQEIIYNKQQKIMMLKTKLGIRDDVKKHRSQTVNKNMESLTDSLISLSIADQVKAENDKLSGKKISAIRNLLSDRQTTIIKPNRPERSDINSIVVLEKRYQEMKKKVKNEKKQSTEPPRSVQLPQQKPQENVQVSKPIASQPFQQQQQPVFKIGLQNQVQPSQQTMPQQQIQKPQAFGQPNMFAQQPIKPITTINNTNVAVSATFSIPLSSKVSSSTDKTAHQPQTITKQAEPELSSKNENVTFTFKLPDKKDHNTIKPINTFLPTPETPKSENKAEPAKPAFSFGNALGSGDGKLSFGSVDSKLGFGSLSFMTKSSPFASLTPTTLNNSSAPTGVTITQVDSSKPQSKEGIALPKPTPVVSNEPSKPTNFFNIPALAPSTTTSSTSETSPAPPATSLFANIKPKEPTSIGLGPEVSKPTPIPATTAASSASAFSFASLMPAATPQDSKPFEVSQPVKPSPIAFGVTPSAEATKTTATTTSASSTFSFANLAFSTPPSTKPSIFGTATTTTTSSAPTTSAPSLFASLSALSTDTKAPLSFGGALAPKTETETSSNAQPAVVPQSVSPTVTTTTSAPKTVPVSPLSSLLSSPVTSQPQEAQTAPPQAPITTSSEASVTITSTSQVNPSDVFKNFNICSPTASVPSSTTASPGNIFGGATAFGTPKSENTNPSIFGGSQATSPFSQTNPVSTPQSTSIFGGSTFGSPAPTTQSQSAFGVTITDPSKTNNVPMNLVKPDQSVFGSISSSTTVSSNPTSPFSSFPSGGASTGGSIFGGGATTNATQSTFGQPSSPFSGFGTQQQQQPVATTASTGFGSPFGTSTQATSGGSLFGGSTFGSTQQNTGSIFGGQNSFANQPGPNATTGSMFGGENTSPFSQSSIGFGGAPKPAFGASPTFGNPAFGGAATFGNPKPSFGIFSQQQTSPQPAAPTQGNNLFEQLGASSNFGVTFGNLAQTSPVQQQPQPTAFASSAFSNWR